MRKGRGKAEANSIFLILFYFTNGTKILFAPHPSGLSGGLSGLRALCFGDH